MLGGSGDLTPLVVGGIGGVLRFLLNRRRPWWEVLIAAVFGMALGYYGAPVATPIAAVLIKGWFGVDIDVVSLTILVALLIGMFGRDAAEATIDVIRLWRARPPA